MNSTLLKLGVIALAIIMLVLAFIFDLHTLLTLSNLQSTSASLKNFVDANPIRSFFIAFGIMVFIYSLPLPAAALMSLTAGYVFNFSIGLLLVLSSSLLAAAMTFLVSRYIARDWLAEKFARYMDVIDREIEAHGFLYALGIRMVPGIPFIALNSTLGITKLRLSAFCLSTFLGTVPISAILVNAGGQFNNIQSMSDILTPKLILSLLLLASFPIIVRIIKSFVVKKVS